KPLHTRTQDLESTVPVISTVSVGSSGMEGVSKSVVTQQFGPLINAAIKSRLEETDDMDEIERIMEYVKRGTVPPGIDVGPTTAPTQGQPLGGSQDKGDPLKEAPKEALKDMETSGGGKEDKATKRKRARSSSNASLASSNGSKGSRAGKRGKKKETSENKEGQQKEGTGEDTGGGGSRGGGGGAGG
ncbi:hypothetical protein TrRE_jg9729, partial [Triparma retinervis]